VLSRQVHLSAQRISGLDGRIEAMMRNHARCYTDSTEVTDIQSLLNKAQYSSAAALAQLALTNVNAPVCPATQAGIGSLWYTASMEGLLSMPATGPSDQTPVLTWRSIEREADALGLVPSERLNPLTVFSLAYTAHAWQLARAAFASAWSQQIVSPSDLNDVIRYYSDLRNLGLALASRPNSSTRRQGYVVLATSDAIDYHYRLGQGEARTDLIRLLRGGSWPRPDWSDPVLAAASHRQIGR
jgi:hypothetical protein